MFRDLSLKVKQPMYISALLAMAKLVLSLTANEEVRRASLEAACERLQRVKAQLVTQTELSFDVQLTAASALAREARISALLATPEDPLARAAAGTALSSTMRELQVVAIDVRDAEGGLVLLAGGESWVSSAYRPLLGEGAETGPLLAVEGRVVYPTTVRVLADAGVLVGSVSIWRRIQVDSAGLEVLQDLIGVDGTILFGSAGGPWTDLVGGIAAPAVDLLEGAASAPGVLVSYDREGVGRVFATPQRLERAPWYIVVELRADDVLVAARDFLVRLALLGPFALIGVAASAWVLGRSLTLSLAETATAAEAIAAGDIGRRVTVRGRDELGRLGRSFNEMA
jgi:HAMP domain-containing protein